MKNIIAIVIIAIEVDSKYLVSRRILRYIVNLKTAVDIPIIKKTFIAKFATGANCHS